MMARRNLTDRAHRYRAQNLAPRGRKVCAWCGSTRNIVPDHIDGHPDHTTPSNLQWLCKSCNTAKGYAFKMAGKARLTNQYNPKKKGIPTFEQYVWAVANHRGGEFDEGGAIIHATPREKRKEYARRIWDIRRERGTDSQLPDWARNPMSKNPSKFDRCVRDVKKHGGAANAYAVCTAQGTRNPAEGAASMSERFHGRKVIEVKEVSEEVHYHTHLSELGELERLKVRAMDGAKVTLEEFEGALLCSNEDGSQLFIRGGDQSVDPLEFAVEEPFHEKEELGEVIEIRYFTTKDHLGDDGGEATYYHEFGEEDKEAGEVPRRPVLVYSVRDKRLSFVGGGYRVEAEGIAN